MSENRTLWGKLVNTTSNENVNSYEFVDEAGSKHLIEIQMDMQDGWVVEGDSSVYLAEMEDVNAFGEESKAKCGFDLGWNATDNKLRFDITNPERVNVGMLISIAEVDPVSAIRYKHL